MSVVALAILCVLLLGALVYRERAHSKHIIDREQRWERERADLLTRIQHPELILPPPRTEEEIAQALEREKAERPERDEIDLVGAIVPGGLETDA